MTEMILWVNKYLNHFDCDEDQASALKNNAQSGIFPNLLVHGPLGIGKKERIKSMLRILYGSGVDLIENSIVTVTIPTEEIIFRTVSSDYHIEVNATDMGIHDRIVIRALVKSITRSPLNALPGQPLFKVLIINEAEDLSITAQNYLLRIMWKYETTCRFILIAHSLMLVTPALHLKCLVIEVPQPDDNEIASALQRVCDKEGLILPRELAMRIANHSERNLKRALLICQSTKLEKYPFTVDQELSIPQWEVIIKDIATAILTEQSPSRLAAVTQALSTVLSQGLPPDVLFDGLVGKLLNNSNIAIEFAVLTVANRYRIMMNHEKQISALKAFVAKFMIIFRNFREEAVADPF